MRRVVLHSPDDLSRLAAGSVVLAAFPAGAMEKFEHGTRGAWMSVGSPMMYPDERVPLPAIVLWDAGVEGSRSSAELDT